MKKYILLAMISTLGITGCSDSFLEVSPSNNILESEYYNSEERIFSALVAAYDPLQWNDYIFGEYSAFSLLNGVMSDEIKPGGGHANDVMHLQLLHKFQATPDYTCGSLWTGLYSGINRSNIVVKYMPQIPNISDVKEDQYLAEAYTLRAYYYSWLWKFFGNVPYYTENPKTPPYFVPQQQADQVYQNILSDLNFALEGNKLPLSVADADKGRITRGMAQMLRADIIMLQNDEANYAVALADMEEIIASGVYSLRPDFQSIFEDAGEWSEGSIFEINYHDANSIRSWGYSNGAGGSVIPSLVGINGFSGPEFQGGWGFGCVQPDLYAKYSDKDQRRDGGILSWEFFTKAHPEATYSPRHDDTGFFMKKLMGRIGGNSACTGDKDLNWRNNVRLYRYAETLLNAAELLVRTGGDQAKAQLYLDQVRARAFKVTVDELSVEQKKTATLDNIIEERRVELAFEGKRYFDLVRTGKAVEVLGTRGYTDAKRFIPLPGAELDKDPNLVQNPY